MARIGDIIVGLFCIKCKEPVGGDISGIRDNDDLYFKIEVEPCEKCKEKQYDLLSVISSGKGVKNNVCLLLGADDNTGKARS